MTANRDINIARHFAQLANRKPDHAAIIAADITLSYSKLWRIVRGFATRMQDIGITREAVVAIHSDDMIACLASMMATSLLGARFVSFDKLLLDHGPIVPTHFLRSPDAQPHPGVSYHMVDSGWPQAARPNPVSDGSEFEGHSNADDPWWLVHTSGTTGAPKYLCLSQRDVYLRSQAVKADFKAFETRFCCLFPCNSRPFLARANAALINASSIVDSVDVDFMRSAGVNSLYGAPRTTKEWLGTRRISPKMPLLQVGGAKLSDADAKMLLESFEQVEEIYGASETNKSFVNVKSLVNGQLNTTGKPLDSEVQIIAADGSAITAIGSQGAVRVRNSYLASHYIGDARATEKAFRGGWFYPGDRACWGPSRELVISGRVDEIINLGGVKVDPTAIDETLCSVEGIAEAVVFRDPTEPTPPRLVAMVTLGEPANVDQCVAAAHLACKERFGEIIAPRYIIVVEQIPITLDGLPRRAECERLAKFYLEKNHPSNVIQAK